MTRSPVHVLSVCVVALALASLSPSADSTIQPLPLGQNWADTSLIVTSDTWTGVPGIIGYRGDGLTSATGVDPQTVLAEGTNVVDVNANQSSPNTFATGGVAEFHLADPVVALQGSGTADAPHLLINISTIGTSNVTVAYNLRDIDGSADNAVQPVALHFRIGSTGDFTNVPAAFVADATEGPGIATLVTPVSVTLPAAVNNQPHVQLRILTTDAPGSDEWVGVDDIAIGGEAVPTLAAAGTASPPTVSPGGSVVLRVTVSPASDPPSTGITVTADLSPIGGSASQPFAETGANVFSHETVVTGAPGPIAIPIAVADGQGRTVTTQIALTIEEPPVPADVVVSQVYGGGGNTGAPYKNDFIELFNRGASAISLSGWSLQYASSGGTTWQATPLTGTIAAGGYYLVQQAAGTGVAPPLPAADATGTIAMSATAGKIALVNTTTALSGSCPASVGIVDFVGFGAASCFEGSGPTSAPSNTNAALRAAAGCVDTDDNASDFSAGPPSPRNSASPLNVCATTLAVNDVTVAEGDSGTVTASFTVGLNIAAPAGGVTFDVATADGTASSAAGDYVAASLTGQSIPQGQQTYTFVVTVNGDTAVEANETFFVNVTNVSGAAVSDGQGVGTIQNDDAVVIPIHAIQGDGLHTPFAGQFVATSGIVTGLTSNGFFMQTADADADADPRTSQGLFVFTSAPPVVAPGDAVTVSGTAAEFFDLTQVQAAAVTVTSPGHPLPSAVALTTSILDANGSPAQLEPLEGMRVHAATLISVAPTDEFGEIHTVLGGVARPMREPGIEISLAVPPDPATGLIDCCIPRWDENPERLILDTDGLLGSARVHATSNVTFTNVAGPLDFSFGRYKLLPAALVPATPNMTAVAAPEPALNEFTVAGYNIENFNASNVTQRLKASLAIRAVLRYPDVIGVIEIANLSSLEALASQINADAIAAGDANPAYEARLIPASPSATQNVGFLVKTSRVRIDAVTQELAADTFTNPINGQPETLHDRPPLVLRATILDPTGQHGGPLIVVVNHLRSFIDIELVAGEGVRVRAKRTAQAESIAGLLQQLQTGSPNTPIVAVGDYNAFEFSDGYTDPLKILRGLPTVDDQLVVGGSGDFVEPDFVNLTDTLPADQRYSFIFEGTPQALDHVLVNGVARGLLQRYAIARNNADFPGSADGGFAGDSTRPEANSDHDMPVAYFAFPGTPVVTLIGGATLTVEAFTTFTDPGATAHDDTGTLAVTVTGAVDVNVPGDYVITYSATNGFQTTSVERVVHVVDSTPPAITGLGATPAVLGEPNHRLVDVSVFYGVADGSGSAACTLAVSSNEPANAAGDGNTAADWVVVSSTHVQLRAERSGRGAGRIYTLTLTCRDGAGNQSVATTTVSVPK